MLGPYKANNDGTISYIGNKVFPAVKDVKATQVNIGEMENRVDSLKKNAMWIHIARINHTINLTANNFFTKKMCLFTPLPLTTRMISSPGAVYGKEAISYTTDTCPIKLQWFDLPKMAFLSESSQIYLELALLQSKELTGVYSIYNSFRKEKADFSHLAEFHHIEFEGKCTQEQNLQVALEFLEAILRAVLANNLDDLRFFLTEEKIQKLRGLAISLRNVPQITFKRALEILYEHTKDEKYLKFTLENFGSWEEVKLTEILQNMVIVKDFPLLEVPFYHAMHETQDGKVANNADIIWPGYREILGSGQRVGNETELEKKAEIFSLPRDDYKPYLQSRKYDDYEITSGFGLGWERLLQGLLEMPYIWTACQFPRVDGTLRP